MKIKRSLFAAIEFTFDRLLYKRTVILFPFRMFVVAAQTAIDICLFLNNEFLKSRFARCGKGVRIHGKFTGTGLDRLTLGNNVHINKNAIIRAEGGVRIGDNTHIGKNLVIYSINHDYNGSCLPYDEHNILKPVSVGKNVWIGINVCITPGVSIGDGAIIGMGSVISKDVESLEIVGSLGHRVLKERNRSHYDRLNKAESFGGMSGYKKNSS